MGRIKIQTQTEPATPPAGEVVVYPDSADKHLKTKDENGTVIDLTDTGAGGETNTASNVGTAGTGIFKQKTGVDLEFKKLNAASSKVTITDDTGNDEVDVDIVEANIDHDALSNWVAAQHRIINDAGSSTTELFSASKILELLGSSFDNEYQYVESVSISSTTSSNWQEKLTMSTGVVPAGDYIITWSFDMKTATSAQDCYVQVELDNSFNLVENILEGSWNGQWMNWCNFEVATLTNASHTVDIDYGGETSGAGTVKIKNAKLEIWRVS